MFFKKRRENKRKELRKDQYLELNKKFRENHNTICRWYLSVYKSDNKGKQRFLNERLNPFFGENGRYGELPKSFNLWVGVNSGFQKDFDYYPIEKLQALYNEIEIEFPEAFLDIKRKDKINNILK
jgi:hypothetical protein